ncbi:MAG: HAD-IA family hydrolase [Litorimonas sp.]
MTRADSANFSRPLAGLSICFDLDGTLVDTAKDLVRVTNAVIAQQGVGPTDYRKARAVVGLGSRRLISDALKRAGRTVGPDRLDKLQEDFLRLYREDIAQLSHAFPHVVPTLAQLRTMGAELSVCTNKPGWLARPLLDALDLTDWFTTIVGGDEAPRAKPSAEHIYAAAGHRDGTRIVMVGDGFPDTRAARNAGAYSVMMTYGYTHIPQIRLRADARLRNFRDLSPTLVDWYAGRNNARETV